MSATNNQGKPIMIRKILASILALAFVGGTSVALTGCNTMEGFGKDVEKGGREIKEEAREHKRY